MLRFVSTSHSSAHLLFLVVVVENFSQLFFFLVSSPKQCPACQEYFSKFSFCICVHTVVYLFCQSGKLFFCNVARVFVFCVLAVVICVSVFVVCVLFLSFVYSFVICVFFLLVARVFSTSFHYMTKE